MLIYTLFGLAAIIWATLIIRFFSQGSGPDTIPAFHTRTRLRRVNLWNVYQLHKLKESRLAFYLGDDASKSIAFLEPVYGEARSQECWMVLGERRKGGRRLLDRLGQGLSHRFDKVFYLTCGPSLKDPSALKNDEAYSFFYGQTWNLWCHGFKNLSQLRLIDPNVSHKRIWQVLQSYAQSISSDNQAARMMSSPDLLAYLEALWPLISSSPSWKSAYQKCARLFDIGKDANLDALRKYLSDSGRMNGDWALRLSKTLNSRQFNDALNFLWEFLRQWAAIESGEFVDINKPHRWFCIFPEDFAAAAGYTIEVLLATCSPGLICLDRLGELLAPEYYLEQVQRLKKAGWAIIICEPNLTWVKRGDEGEDARLGSLVDNWIFGTQDASSAILLERYLGLEQETIRSSKTDRGAFGGNATTRSVDQNELLPVGTLVSIPYDKAVVAWKYPPSFEPNRVRYLSLDS